MLTNDMIDDINSDELDNQSLDFASLSQRDKRALIFHLLYAAESFDYQISLEAVVDNFNRGFNLDIPLDSDVVTTAQSIIDQRDSLDTEYKPLLSNWRFDRLGVCTKLILRFAIWEFLNTQLPSIVIINEAIELAKCFAEKDAYKFINGILDEMLKKITRTEEPEVTSQD